MYFFIPSNAVFFNLVYSSNQGVLDHFKRDLEGKRSVKNAIKNSLCIQINSKTTGNLNYIFGGRRCRAINIIRVTSFHYSI